MDELFNQLFPAVSSFKRKLKRHTRVKPIYIESTLGDNSLDCLYTGFSGDIEEGGLFIATYDLKSIGTEVAVRVSLPDGSKVGVRGVITWHREFNPLTPETVPGMGIKLSRLDPKTRSCLCDHLLEHPGYFFDDTPMTRGSEDKSMDSNIESQIESMLEQFCLASTQQLDNILEPADFASGLLRDTYIQNAPAATKETPKLKPVSLIVQLLPFDRTNRQFNGGFQKEDLHKLFIATARSIKIHTPIHLVIEFPNRRKIKADGVVRWTRKPNPKFANPSVPSGVGVCLTSLSMADWPFDLDECPMTEEIF